MTRSIVEADLHGWHDRRRPCGAVILPRCGFELKLGCALGKHGIASVHVAVLRLHVFVHLLRSMLHGSINDRSRLDDER